MLKKTVLVALTLFIIIFIGGAVYYFLFMPNSTVVPAFAEGKLNLVIEGELIDSMNQPRMVDNEILLPLAVIKEYIDTDIYWDEILQKVTITTKDSVIRMKTDSLDAFVNNKAITLDIPVSESGGIIYVPIEFLSDFYNIEIAYLKANNIIVIDFKNSIRQLAEPISANAVVRRGPSVKYPIIRKFDLNDTEDGSIRIFEEYEKWYKVRTTDGAVGYIEKRFVVVRRMMVTGVAAKEDNNGAAWKPLKGKVNLVWDQIWSERTVLPKTEFMEGLDVVSPTWLQVKNAEGKLINRTDAIYVEWAHMNGYKVWALLANDFNNVPMTKKLLNSTDARDTLIRDVLAYAALYKLDGINIDFENLDDGDRDALTQLVREMTPLLREQGLIVTINVNLFPCYDTKALAETVDYVMLMAYDQHWKGGSEAGSVAQVAWVESIINRFLQTIPKEKLLLGLPFYTRVWEEKSDGKGGMNLSSKALSMQSVREIILQNNAPVKWDEESGQFYSEFTIDKSLYKVWIEDANSINLKLALVQKYKLGGAASWSKNFAVPEIWGVLNRNLKVINNYQEWKLQNDGRVLAYN